MNEFINKLCAGLKLTSYEQKRIAQMLVRQRYGSLVVYSLDKRLKELRAK